MMHDHPRTSSLTWTDRLARNLGWFSIGLGLAELIAPGRIGRAVGLDNRQGLLRAYGGRELLAGVGALSMNPTPAIWSRVAGDVLDLGTLVKGRSSDGARGKGAAIAIGAVAGVLIVDALSAALLHRQNTREPEPPRDYAGRSGFPKGVAAARGAARRLAGSADMRAGAAPARPIDGRTQELA